MPPSKREEELTKEYRRLVNEQATATKSLQDAMTYIIVHLNIIQVSPERRLEVTVEIQKEIVKRTRAYAAAVQAIVDGLEVK